MIFNMLSGLTFLVGGLVAYVLSHQMDITWLIPFAAGNFLYIGASGLVPEVNKQDDSNASYVHVADCLVGAGLLLATRLFFDSGQDVCWNFLVPHDALCLPAIYRSNRTLPA